MLKTVKALRDEDIDLTETPALFTWSYEEEPWIKFKLLISETEQAQLDLGSELH